MKNSLFLFALLVCSSCELHEQTNVVGEKTKARVVNLSVIEEISSAIVQNDIEAISAVLDGGVFEVNIPDKSGELILNKAIKSNRFVIGDLLLKNGADPSSQDEQGHSGLSLAGEGTYTSDWTNLFGGDKLTSETARLQIFNSLEGANPNIEKKFLPLIKGLIELGAPKDGVGDGGFTYLMVASSKDLLGIVDLFCQHPEIDPNITVERGRGRRKKTFSALILAASDSMRSLLTKCGATQ